MGATVSQITTATIDYLSSLLSKGEYTFCGDSLDRERVRDIMISKFNLKESKPLYCVYRKIKRYS